MDHWKMNLLLGYVGFREGNTTRHFLRSTSARALGTRQAKSFCVELPVQLHGRLYDLGQHCPHRTNVEWPSGEVHFANFCFCSLWNLLFQMQKKSRLTNQPPVGAKPDPTNRVDHRTREWSFQRIPVWTPRLGVKPREPRGGMGDVFFLSWSNRKNPDILWNDSIYQIRVLKKGRLQFNTILYSFTLGLLRSSQISTLNLKGFPCSSSCQVIWRLEERLPWFVCEAWGWI